MATVLDVHRDEICEHWTDTLLRLPGGIYQGQPRADVLISVEHLFQGFVDSLGSGDSTGLRETVIEATRKRFEAGFPLAALLETVGAARTTFLPVLATALGTQTPLLTECIAALMAAEERTAVWIAEAYETVSDALLRTAQEDRLRAEHDKVAFGRDITRLVTKERLVLCDPADVPPRNGLAVLPVVRPRDVRDARSIVRDHATALGWPPARTYELQLCVGEAGTNAVRHAGTATFQAWTEDDNVTFRFADTGPGIDFNRIPSAISSGYSTGASLGMGFTLMLELADTIQLATDNHGTVLQLTLTRR